MVSGRHLTGKLRTARSMAPSAGQNRNPVSGGRHLAGKLKTAGRWRHLPAEIGTRCLVGGIWLKMRNHAGDGVIWRLKSGPSERRRAELPCPTPVRMPAGIVDYLLHTSWLS